MCGYISDKKRSFSANATGYKQEFKLSLEGLEEERSTSV